MNFILAAGGMGKTLSKSRSPQTTRTEQNLYLVVEQKLFRLVLCGIIMEESSKKACKTLRRNCKYYFNIENDKLYT